MLDLLWTEYRKSDVAARAAARFERDVHNQLVQQRADEGFSEDEAGEIRRVFRAADFNTTYRQLLQLRMEIMLLRRLDLEQYEQDIMRARIRTTFGPPQNGTKQVVVQRPTDQLSLGSPEAHQVQELKQRGRRRRRR